MVNYSKIAGMGQKKPKPKTVSSGRNVSKKKQQMGMGKGKKGLGMTNVMTGQQTTRTSKPKVKRAIDTQKRSKSPVAAQAKPKPTLRQRLKRLTGLAGGGKTSKYRMAGGGKASKYRMKGGGKTSKYMAKGGKTSKYMRRGGKVK